MTDILAVLAGSPIAEIVPDDPAFPDSLAQTFDKIRSMIDEAR